MRHFVVVILLASLLLVAACTLTPQAAREPLSAFTARAQPLLAEQRYTEAAAVLEQAAQVHPEAPTPLLQLGRLYLIQRRWLLAEDAFNRALARDLDNTQAMAGLAEALLRQGRFTEAHRWWQQAAGLAPKQPGVFTGLGRTYLQLYNLEAAQAAFSEQQARVFDPAAAWYLAALAAPLDRPAALNYLHTIPANAPPALLAQRDYLLKTLAPFTNASPQAEVAQAGGIALAQIEQWPLAIHALNVALAQTGPSLSATDRAETLAFLGYASAQAGRPALDLFDQARQADADLALPSYFEGLYLRQQGALQAAEASFKQALQLDPQNPALYVEMASTKAAQGDLLAAELWHLAAVEVAEDDFPFQLLLLKFYAGQNYAMREAGIPLAEEMIETNSQHAGHAEIYDLLGWMQFLTETADGGEEALRQALALDPGLSSAHYHLARLLEARGQPYLARQEYQRVVDLDTGGNLRDRALKDLLRLPQAGASE